MAKKAKPKKGGYTARQRRVVAAVYKAARLRRERERKAREAAAKAKPKPKADVVSGASPKAEQIRKRQAAEVKKYDAAMKKKAAAKKRGARKAKRTAKYVKKALPKMRAKSKAFIKKASVPFEDMPSVKKATKAKAKKKKAATRAKTKAKRASFLKKVSGSFKDIKGMKERERKADAEVLRVLAEDW